MRQIDWKMHRSRSCLTGVAVAAALALVSSPAQADTRVHETAEVQDALRSAASSNRQVEAFYAARGYRPIWIGSGGLTPKAVQAYQFVASAHLDGLKARKYKVGSLRKALRRAENGEPRDLARAEVLLSRAFVAYVRALHRPETRETAFVDPGLAPSLPALDRILNLAAGGDVERATQKHPVYLQLRRGYGSWLETAGEFDPGERQLNVRIRRNMERARVLPDPSRGRHVLVDAGAARLWMYDGDRVFDSMKVVVGKPAQPTPIMAALIRYAAVNPYWNLPPDLVGERVAPSVLGDGLGYLKAKGYEVLSDWSASPKRIDPATIDWKAVADGRLNLRVRQLPGPANAMGRMKFMFPNQFGVYLHDTPDKGLFGDEARLFSAGCVRLENASRLAKWLFGKVPSVPKAKAEQHVPLRQPVPVYITYLTVAPAPGGGLAFRDDFYGRDGGNAVQYAQN